jgi:hypothetical protein
MNFTSKCWLVHFGDSAAIFRPNITDIRMYIYIYGYTYVYIYIHIRTFKEKQPSDMGVSGNGVLPPNSLILTILFVKL